MVPWCYGMLCQCRQAKEKLQDGSEWVGSTAVPRQGIGVQSLFLSQGLCSLVSKTLRMDAYFLTLLP